MCLKLDPAAPACEDVVELGAQLAWYQDEQPIAGLDEGASAWWDRLAVAVDDCDQSFSWEAELAYGRSR